VGETCSLCSSDCGQAHDADINPCDGSISVNELADYIYEWKLGNVEIDDLIEAIVMWKTGYLFAI